MMKRKGCLIVVSGASGTGKGTVCSALLEARPQLKYSISATTRPPREGEVDGVNYYFLAKDEFEKQISAGGFLEWAEVFGNYYGTPKQRVIEALDAGQDILLEIDVQGTKNVMGKMPDGVFIFLLPPSLEELEKRLRQRGTDSEEAIKKRLEAARGEFGVAGKYRYVVVNDTVEAAVKKIEAIITAEHARTPLNYDVLAKIAQG